MRKTSVWVLCVLFVLTTAAFAAAQTTAAPAKQAAGSDMAKPADAGAAAATTSTTTSTTTATKTTKKSSSHKKTPSATGEVTAYDATAKTIAVKGTKDSWTFSWDDKTVVTPKGSTPAVGDKVTVWYTTSGDTKTATKIKIWPAKKTTEKKPA